MLTSWASSARAWIDLKSSELKLKLSWSTKQTSIEEPSLAYRIYTKWAYKWGLKEATANLR